MRNEEYRSFCYSGYVLLFITGFPADILISFFLFSMPDNRHLIRYSHSRVEHFRENLGNTCVEQTVSKRLLESAGKRLRKQSLFENIKRKNALKEWRGG